MFTVFRNVFSILKRISEERPNKKSAELDFWKREIPKYVEWYQGKRYLYNFTPPAQTDKHSEYGLPVDALITWLILYQQQKYLADLRISADQFCGMRILDVGCGPFPSIFVFKEAEYYGIDPLINEYRTVGYPIDLWAHQGFHYYANSAEEIPFDDSFFHVVISVNAIDHVDYFAQTAREVKRVLKPDGVFRMHVHYHKKKVCEPIELNDQVFLENYSWVSNLKKIYQSRTKDTAIIKRPDLYFRNIKKSFTDSKPHNK